MLQRANLLKNCVQKALIDISLHEGESFSFSIVFINLIGMYHFTDSLKILLNYYVNIFQEPVFINPRIPGVGKCNPEIENIAQDYPNSSLRHSVFALKALLCYIHNLVSGF